LTKQKHRSRLAAAFVAVGIVGAANVVAMPAANAANSCGNSKICGSFNANHTGTHWVGSSSTKRLPSDYRNEFSSLKNRKTTDSHWWEGLDYGGWSFRVTAGTDADDLYGSWGWNDDIDSVSVD